MATKNRDSEPARVPGGGVVREDAPAPPRKHGKGEISHEATHVRVETLTTDAPSEVARYASLFLSGAYAAEYLRLALVEE